VCEWHVKLCDPKRFRDKGLIIKRYINSSVYFNLLYLMSCALPRGKGSAGGS